MQLTAEALKKLALVLYVSMGFVLFEEVEHEPNKVIVVYF